MLFHDIYVLGESNVFELKNRQDAAVNLNLKKILPCYHTFLTGKVCCNNLPIKNAAIMVMDHNGCPLSSTTTDGNGNYKFHNVLKSGKYKITASAIGYHTSYVKTIKILENIITKQSFRLKKSKIFKNGTVYGKIFDAENKKPIENASVSLKSEKNNGKIIYSSISNYKGQFLIYNVCPNNYQIIVEKQGYRITKPQLLKIRKQNRILLHFDLIKNLITYNHNISGMITYHEHYISNAAVFLYLIDNQENEKIVQIQETNEHGMFLFSNVENGFYRVKGFVQNKEIYKQDFMIE